MSYAAVAKLAWYASFVGARLASPSCDASQQAAFGRGNNPSVSLRLTAPFTQGSLFPPLQRKIRREPWPPLLGHGGLHKKAEGRTFGIL